MNSSFGNHSAMPRMALGNLGNLSNAEGNNRDLLQSQKMVLGNASPFPSKDSQNQSKTQRTPINTLNNNDPENLYPKGNNAGKMEEDLGRKSTNKPRGEMFMNPKSPEFGKAKKSLVQFKAVTPQEKASDQVRQEKRRLSHSIPAENKFGQSYKIDDRLQVNETLDADLAQFSKKLNFFEEFGTKEVNLRFTPPEVEEEYFYEDGIIFKIFSDT